MTDLLKSIRAGGDMNFDAPIVQEASRAHSRIYGFCEKLTNYNIVLPPRIGNDSNKHSLLKRKANLLRGSIFGKFYGTDLFEMCGLVLDTAGYPVRHFAESEESFVSTLANSGELLFRWKAFGDSQLLTMTILLDLSRVKPNPIVQICLNAGTAYQYEISHCFVENKLKDRAWFVLKTIDGKEVLIRREGIRINESGDQWLEPKK